MDDDRRINALDEATNRRISALEEAMQRHHNLKYDAGSEARASAANQSAVGRAGPRRQVFETDTT